MGGSASRGTWFAGEISRALRARGMSQAALAERLDVSTAYISSLSTGKKHVSAARVASIARELDADKGEEGRLHRAAALDAGFRLDLPDDF